MALLSQISQYGLPSEVQGHGLTQRDLQDHHAQTDGETETQEGTATSQSPQRVVAGIPHAGSRKPNLYNGHAQSPNP